MSGPAGLFLTNSAVAEWGGGGWRAVSVEVGRAGGQAAAVIPEGPGFSAEVRCCAPVNRHAGREGGKTCDMCQLGVNTENHNSLYIPYSDAGCIP